MNKTITAKHTTNDRFSVRFHNLEVARYDPRTERLTLAVLPSDRACHTRINQSLKSWSLPVVLDVRPVQKAAYLVDRGTRRDVASVEFPSWNSPRATCSFSRVVGPQETARAA